MSLTDPIADLLTRLRNAQQAKKSTVTCLFSKIGMHILEVLKSEGYIRAYAPEEVRAGIQQIQVELKYYEGKPVISEITRVSRPGRRVYSSLEKLPKMCNGLGILILSTSQGVMTDTQAKNVNASGEILCRVF